MKNYVVTITLIKNLKIYDTNNIVKLKNSTELYVPSFRTKNNINPDYFIEEIVDKLYDFYKQYITANLGLYSKVKRDTVKLIVKNELNDYMFKGRKKTRTIFIYNDDTCDIEMTVKEYVS